MKKGIEKELLEWVICFVIAYIIYLAVSNLIGTISGVKQISMFPTAKEGDKLVISRRVLFKKPLERGQIITFEAPESVSNSSKEQTTAQFVEYKGITNFFYKVMGIGKTSYIKRVIATEGEHIYISEDGKIYVNDEIIEEPYLVKDTVTERTGKYYDLVVPEGTVFVMGDNREFSKDSRELGCIPLNKVEGNVVIRIWPLNKMGKLDKVQE